MRIFIGLFLTIWLFLGQTQISFAADQVGQIKVTSGEVVIVRGGTSIPAEPGTALMEQDVIRTGANSAVGMTFTDNSRVSLGPESELSLQKYAYQRPGQPDSFEAKLENGSLTAASGKIAKSRPLAMRVLTPTTVLGVKGTDFAVRVGAEG